MNPVASMNIARSYARQLYPLSNEVKRDIVKLLIDSIVIPTPKNTETADEMLDRLYGCWAEDKDMENIGEAIRNERVSGKTREIISLDR